MDTEHLAALVAAVAVFAGIVAPTVVVAIALAVIAVGLLARLLRVRVGSGSRVHNPG